MMAQKLMTRQSQAPRLSDDLLVDEIFTRLPAAAAGRFRAVCRAWNAALTSDDFIRARAAARQPELLFFMPSSAAADQTTLAFYTCTLRDGNKLAPPSAARELLTVSNLRDAGHVVVMSPKPCRGLTLILVGGGRPASGYYVCNLSTGEHVAVPEPCNPAAAMDGLHCSSSRRIGMGFHCRSPPWIPFHLESAGLGFDHATGDHKVVRLFKSRNGETRCEVCCIPSNWGSADESRGWRPCSGRVPPQAAGFVVAMQPVFLDDGDGHLYWLLEVGGADNNSQPAILSFSVGAEQFDSTTVPPPPARRVCHLAALDASSTLCAAVDLRHEIGKYVLFTWTRAAGASSSSSWSLRCCVDLQSLPKQISDEFVEEWDVVPLCCNSSAGAGEGKILLLATGRHKVFAYDPGRRAMERVFFMREFVDVPYRHRDASPRLNIVLHEEHINLRMPPNPFNVQGDEKKKKLQIKLGSSNTIAKREVQSDDEHHRDDHRFRYVRDLFKELAGLTLPHMNII